jgi:hypothetical protein
MTHPVPDRPLALRILTVVLHGLKRAVMVALGSLSTVGAAGGKPALPPEVPPPPPNEYRP